MDNGWQNESKSFAGACLSNSNHVSPRQSNRPPLSLDGCWFHKVLLVLDDLHNILGELGLFKCGHWLGNVLSFHSDFIVLSEFADFIFTPFLHIRVFLYAVHQSICLLQRRSSSWMVWVRLSSSQLWGWTLRDCHCIFTFNYNLSEFIYW